MSHEARLIETLQKRGLTLPSAAEPKGLYKPVLVTDNFVYTSGHLPIDSDGRLTVGRIGERLDVEAGYTAALLAGLGILASLHKELGTLDRVRCVVKIFGAVNCTPDFTKQPAVVNGCSDLFADVFGRDAGVGARTAIGVNTLPLGVPVEIEAVFETKRD
jgi:enamine deaminase RidA (YjgF/YER057c/UK114 family)